MLGVVKIPTKAGGLINYSISHLLNPMQISVEEAIDYM
jgi:hypothetical protein